MANFKQVYIGSDHNGFILKDKIADYLRQLDYQVEDLSNQQLDPGDDFPVFAAKAAHQVLAGEKRAAILICGGGQGMCMAANRFRGIRASVLWDPKEASLTRNDNNANVCCLPAHIVEKNDQLWKEIVDNFLNTPFAAAPRFIRRNKQIDNF